MGLPFCASPLFMESAMAANDPKIFHTEVKMELRITCAFCRYNFSGKLTDLNKDVSCPSCGNTNHINKVPDFK